MKISMGPGLPVALRGAPAQEVGMANAVTHVGLSGLDYPAMRTEIVVAEGDRVAAGQPVFRDRKRPDIVITAPVSGAVETISIGARRRLGTVLIAAEGSDKVAFSVPATVERDTVRRLLLESGMWTGFIARPFGRTPDPDATPHAIVVTALDTRPHAVAAQLVQIRHRDALARGLEWLRHLTDGPVYFCHDASEVPSVPDGITPVAVAGAHPAGAAGLLIDRLHPAGLGRAVWHIHLQDVVAIGQLAITGAVPEGRIVALAGPEIVRPRLVEIPYGADLQALCRDEMGPGSKRIVSGSALDGDERVHLGRFDWQVSVVAREASERPTEWRPRWAPRRRPVPTIPSAALDRALGGRIPAVPLLRALSVGDAEGAVRLGCLSLLESDLALLNYAGGGEHDFGALLRATLDTLEEVA